MGFLRASWWMAIWIPVYVACMFIGHFCLGLDKDASEGFSVIIASPLAFGGIFARNRWGYR